MDVVDLPLERLIPYARNPRKNTAAVATVAASLKEFGWRQPIVVDEEMVILAGHTRLEAARQLGLATAPVHVARGLTPTQARAYRLMDNRASENAEWDEALLGLELGDLQGAMRVTAARAAEALPCTLPKAAPLPPRTPELALQTIGSLTVLGSSCRQAQRSRPLWPQG